MMRDILTQCLTSPPTRKATKSLPLENIRKESTPRWSQASRWPTYAALAIAVIAVIAVVLAALAYFHPAHNSTSAAQQGGDAKANVCSAVAATRKAVVLHDPSRLVGRYVRF